MIAATEPSMFTLVDATSSGGSESSSVASIAAFAGIGACLLALLGTAAVLACKLRQRYQQRSSPAAVAAATAASIGDSASIRRRFEDACHRTVESVKDCFAWRSLAVENRALGDNDVGGVARSRLPPAISARRFLYNDGAPVGGSSGSGDDDADGHRSARRQSAAEVEGQRLRSGSGHGGQWADDVEAAEVPAAEELGCLRYSLLYSSAEQTLAVSVLSIAGLRVRTAPAEWFEPYVKLAVLPTRYEAKTRVIRGARDPDFDETFTLRCPNLEATVIQFTVCSFDRYSRDVVLGYVTCAVADMAAPVDEEAFLQSPIVSRFNQIILQQPGELLVSLSYQQLASRLVVTVLKARNLPKIDSACPLDTFVSICLLYKGQVIAVRATQVKAGEANPVYNETFLFDLPISEHLDKIAIVAKVCGCSSTMRCEPIGWLEISEQTPVTSQHYHWQQTIAKPGRQVAQWHKLTHEYSRQSMHRSASSR